MQKPQRKYKLLPCLGASLISQDVLLTLLHKKTFDKKGNRLEQKLDEPISRRQVRKQY
jgi:hypothetical protein